MTQLPSEKPELFKGRHFNHLLIVQAVRWYAAYHQAVAELKAEGVLPTQTLVRASKYLNNLIEQDHRRVKQRSYTMLGFKTSGNAEVTLSGIKLAIKIKKGQFDTSEIASPGALFLQVWEAVLAA